MKDLFTEISEYRPLELLRTPYERANHVIAYMARIVAMTSTHAAIRRNMLLEIGFSYQNILMEEAGNKYFFALMTIYIGHFYNMNQIKSLCLLF